MNIKGERFYFISRPDLVKHILHDDAESFPKLTDDQCSQYLKYIKDHIGDALVVQSGTKWMRFRRLLEPLLLGSSLTSYEGIIATCTQELAELWDEKSHCDSTLDLLVEMQFVTRRITCKILFGQGFEEDAASLARALSVIERDFLRREWFFYPSPSVPTPWNLKLRRTRRYLCQLVDEVIAEKSQSLQREEDILSQLWRKKGTPAEADLSKEAIRDQLLGLLMGGSFTTAACLAWTLYLIATHADVERKLIEEIESALGAGGAGLEDIRSMSYLQMTLKESMRLYPPVASILRMSPKAQVVGDYRLKGGSTILVWLSALHKDESIWPRPFHFDPERFSRDRVPAGNHFAFLPFSHGSRFCIGRDLAMFEMGVIVSTLLRRFKIIVAPNQKICPEITTVMFPRNGIKVSLQPRK